MGNLEKNEAGKMKGNKHEIPFFKQTTPLNCGPTVLRMVVTYFDKDLGIDTFEKEVGIEEGKAVSTMQIAIAAASLGYPVDFYSTIPGFNPENQHLKFYKEYGSGDAENFEEWVETAQKTGVNMNKESLELEQVLGFLTPDSVPIVLLNWNVVEGKNEEEYQGHFVPIVGYDDENIYVHNPSLNGGAAYMSIKKEVFDKARKSKGTDEDMMVVFRKEK